MAAGAVALAAKAKGAAALLAAELGTAAAAAAGEAPEAKPDVGGGAESEEAEAEGEEEPMTAGCSWGTAVAPPAEGALELTPAPPNMSGGASGACSAAAPAPPGPKGRACCALGCALGAAGACWSWGGAEPPRLPLASMSD